MPEATSSSRQAYAKLSSWLWFNEDWNWTGTPIVMYLQNSGKQATKAAVAEGAFWEALARANKGKPLRYVKTFTFDDYDYIPTSIHRTFIGKVCPWEIQETIQLASSIGLIDKTNVEKYCRENIGVDCGGFVAAYWGEEVPHMVEPKPRFPTGISPRSFWADSGTWPDVIRRRRTDFTAIKPGDAAIFFTGVKDHTLACQRRSPVPSTPDKGTDVGGIKFRKRPSKINTLSGTNLSLLSQEQERGTRSRF